jgi:dUTP pyrophosphatase
MIVTFAWAADADQALGLPHYASAGAAGADLCANFPDRQDQIIAPGARALIPTGLRMAVDDGYEIQIRPRSGLALKQGLTLLNSPGTIDSDYRGAVGVIVINHSDQPVTISHGMRIAQMVVAPVIRASFTLADDLADTTRGSGGFGSTGT